MRFAARHGDGWITTGTQAGNIEDWFAGVARSVRILDDTSPAGPEATGFPRYLSLTWAPHDPSRVRGRSTI